MRILVTGATGMIGRPVLARLRQQGHETIAYVRKPIPNEGGTVVELGDICNADQLRAVLDRHKPDCVIHLAALLQFACEEDPRQAVDINVTGTVNLLEACRHHGVSRVVFGSSIAVYGQRSDIMREDDSPTTNISVYGETKRLGEVIGMRYHALGGPEFVALRYSGVFGPGVVSSRGMAFARHLIKSTTTEAVVNIPSVSGDETGHLTYISDAVEATCAVTLHQGTLGHSIYNVGGPDDNFMSLRSFHAAVKRVVPTAGKAVYEGPGVRRLGPVDTGRLRRDTGFTPRFTVEDGLRDEFGLARPR